MPQGSHRTDSGETPGEDERALLLAAQAHDGQALARLYEKNVRPVYRYLHSLVGNGPDAEDLTSTTFLQALEALPRYRPGGSFTAWLFRIAHSRAMDHFRRQRPEVGLDPATHPADESDPAGQVIQRQEQELLRRLLVNLTVEQQDLLRLRYIAELSFAEIGRVVGKSEGAVKKHLYRLLARLQTQMEVDHE